MASRLSDLAIKSGYDSGHRSLPWDAPRGKENLLDLNLESLVAAPNAQEILQSIPTQILYHALKRKEMANLAGVLALLSQQQVIRLLDYDCWQEDRLDPKRAFTWLSVVADSDPEALHFIYAGLDEEYQQALLHRYVRVFNEEEKDRLSVAEQDELIPLPGQKSFYSIRSDDRVIVKFIMNLIEVSISVNPAYVFTLLSSSAYAVPEELEALSLQFRNARLEEDGFVPYSESLSAFLPIELDDAQIATSGAASQDLMVSDEPARYLDRVVSFSMQNDAWDDDLSLRMQQGMLLLGNYLCAATKIESDDLDGLNTILEQLKALISLGLEFLSAGNLNAARQVLITEHPKDIFRTGLSVVYRAQDQCLEKFSDRGFHEPVRQLRKLQKQQKWGALQRYLDVDCLELFGFELTENLKGLFNRFPMVLKDIDSKGRQLKFAPIGSMLDASQAKTRVLHLVNQLPSQH